MNSAKGPFMMLGIGLSKAQITMITPDCNSWPRKPMRYLFYCQTKHTKKNRDSETDIECLVHYRAQNRKVSDPVLSFRYK
jgi:hypothetical protein